MCLSPAQSVTLSRTSLGTTKLAAMVMGTGCVSTMPYGMSFAAQSVTLAPSKEIPNFLAEPRSAARPADVLLPNWCQGRPATLDIHVISPLQQATVAEAAYTPGHALSKLGWTANLPLTSPSAMLPVLSTSVSRWSQRLLVVWLRISLSPFM